MISSITKEILEDLYINQKKSLRKIAAELKVAKTTVEYYIKKFKIATRSHEEARVFCLKEYGWTRGLNKQKDSRVAKLAESIRSAWLNKRKVRIENIEKKFGKPMDKLLEHLYWVENLNQEQIAKKIGYDRAVVIGLMKEHNIKKRPKYQYISSLKGKNHSMFGKSWDSLFGREKAEHRRKESAERFRKLTVRRLEDNEFPFFDTEIEKIIANELLKRKIPFVKQFKISNKFVCDIAIPFARVIVECDGDYWHANPRMYGVKKPLNQLQRDKIKRDRLKEKFLKTKEWKLLRFYESDIKLNPDKCGAAIEKAVKEKIE